jgi:hypothetical protein
MKQEKKSSTSGTLRQVFPSPSPIRVILTFLIHEEGEFV